MIRLVEVTIETFAGRIRTSEEIEALRLMGDMNLDGVIDYIDILTFLAAFMSVPGDPNWNPNCDINGDSVVNALDYYILALNYGKRYAKSRMVEAIIEITGLGKLRAPCIVELPVGTFTITGTPTALYGKSNQVRTLTLDGEWSEVYVGLYFEVKPIDPLLVAAPVLIVTGGAGIGLAVKGGK